MKRTLLIALASILAISLNAQGLYSSIKKYDKFDDVTSTRQVKTLIDYDSSENIITIETKGSTPVKYAVVGDAEETGSSSEPVNLVKDLYGYEKDYLCVPVSNYEASINYYMENGLKDKSKEEFDAFKKKFGVVEIVFRTVVTQYTHQYINKIAWIRYYDGARTIYNE